MPKLKIKITNRTGWWLWRQKGEGADFPEAIGKDESKEIEVTGKSAVVYHLNWPPPAIDRRFEILSIPVDAHGNPSASAEAWTLQVSMNTPPFTCVDGSSFHHSIANDRKIDAEQHMEAGDIFFQQEFIFQYQDPPTVPVPTTLDVGVIHDVAVPQLDKAIQLLRNIVWSCEQLESTRRYLQELQQRCMNDLEELRKLRLLAQIQVDRYQARWAQSRSQFDGAGDDGAGVRRLKMVATTQELIESAAEAMLSAPKKDIPYLIRDKEGKWAEVSPRGGSLLAQFDIYATDLCSKLRDKNAVDILRAALKADGDKPFPDRHANLVQAACQIAAQAAFWVGDGAKEADAEAILGSVMEGKGQGPDKAKGVLDLIASLAFSPKDWSDACHGPAPFSLWGAIFDVYIGMKVTIASRANNVQLLEDAQKKMEQALKDVLKQTGTLPVKLELEWGEVKAFFKLLNEGAEVTEKVGDKLGELRQQSITNKLENAQEPDDAVRKLANSIRENGRQEKYIDPYSKIIGFSEPSKLFAPNSNVALQRLFVPVWKAFKGFMVAKSLLAPVLMAMDYDRKKQDALTVAKEAQAGIDALASGIEVLAKLDLIDKEAAEKFGAVLGRVSLVIGVVIAYSEAIVAYRAHDYTKALGEGLVGYGLALMLAGPETGGITVIIAVPFLVIGTILSSHEEIEELAKPTMFGVFDYRLKAFKTSGGLRVGKYFTVELKEQLEEVEKAMKALKAADWTDENLPAKDLARAGVNLKEVS